MKYRWKLLILLLLISIAPIISLRTFGIHNVQLMADDLVSQVRRNQEADARHRLQLMINNYATAIQTTREQVEMALFYQAFEFKRLLLTPSLPNSEIVPASPSDASVVTANPIARARSDASTAADLVSEPRVPNAKQQCLSAPPGADAAQVGSTAAGFQKMAPIHRAASQYLGDLVVGQYLGLENGLFSIFPCDAGSPLAGSATDQVWYRSAFVEKATAWSRPYLDAVSDQTVFAVSYPVMQADESVAGVTSLLVPLNLLLEKAFYIYDLPEGIRPFLCTLAAEPVSGKIGARVMAAARGAKSLPETPGAAEASKWLESSDTVQFRAFLEDIARRKSDVRAMPFGGRMSFWAYGPLLHQGSAFVLIVPRDRIINPEGRSLLASIRNRLVNVENYTAAFLFFLILLVTVISVLFSLTVTRPLARLATAAQELAGGDFDARVPVSSTDEFGILGRIFNRVGPQLKEHYRMRRSLELAEEVQQNLLPEKPPDLPGLDIHGMTLFSDETGGDYFDFLCTDEENKDKFCVAVGDVAGHGISAALLMAFVRGILRSRAKKSGTLGEIVTDVNREFSENLEDSGQFMTLFLARINCAAHCIEWVRAGHEPALLYDPVQDIFQALSEGHGTALGVSRGSAYRSISQPIEPGHIFFVGTDGISEARNAQNALFGSQRVKQIIREQAHAPAKTIALSVLSAVEAFSGTAVREDDLTLVVIKLAKP